MKLYTKTRLLNKLSSESLFHPYGTWTTKELQALDVIRYDMGKYSIESLKDNHITKPDIPVWYEKRKDKYGKYVVLYTFNETPENLVKLWKAIESY